MAVLRKVSVGLVISSASLASLWLAITLSIDRATTAEGSARRLVPQLAFEDAWQFADPSFVLAMAIVRMLLSLYLAVCILVFGSNLPTILTLIQGWTAAGFWGWWSQVSNIAYVADIPPCIERFCSVMVTGSLGGYVMMVQHWVDLIAKGMLFAYQLVDKLLALLQIALMSWSGCTGTWKEAFSVRGQMYDTWINCTNKNEYYSSIFIFKIVEWSVVIAGALLAKKIEKTLAALSAAMLGADLTTACVFRLIDDIVVLTQGREEADKIKTTLMAWQVVICFGLFGVGFFIQLAMRTWVENGCKSEDRDMVIKCFRPLTLFRYPAAPYIKFNFVLTNGVGAAQRGDGEKPQKVDADADPVDKAVRPRSVSRATSPMWNEADPDAKPLKQEKGANEMEDGVLSVVVCARNTSHSSLVGS
eukprot:TRINITY_DN8957_c0_g2_i1.p1 TRINITY_DN8957_c0_g2~~TRINITY_DN8957_c0_g2_i1.p1  ORF type:complete len:446 (+),score=65.63 TRINITY_DN8957_c0_g2_i1:88-1338(+)